MSLPIAPRPPIGGHDPNQPSQSAIAKSRKISTACGACKQRKTKCSGGDPCEACAARNSPCDYDVASDQRRKVANQRNVHELAHAQHELDLHRQLIGGIVAIFRAGTADSTTNFVCMVRNDTDLSSLAAFVRNEIRSSFDIQQAFQAIDFSIDGPTNLPSPTQLLSRMDPSSSQADSSDASGNASGNASGYPLDPNMRR